MPCISGLEDISHLIEKAHAGDVSAQYKLGESYFSGCKTEINYKEAFRWFKKAAEQEHAGAQGYEEARSRSGEFFYCGVYGMA